MTRKPEHAMSNKPRKRNHVVVFQCKLNQKEVGLYGFQLKLLFHYNSYLLRP